MPTARERLETARLQLVRLAPPWEARVEQLYRAPEVMRFIVEGGRSAAEAAAAVERMRVQWREHGYGAWALLAREPKRDPFAGVGLLKREPAGEVELGYALAAGAWGRGYATEAAQALLAVAFDHLGLARVGATVEGGNTASIRVLRKLGFSRASSEALPGGKSLERWTLPSAAWQRPPG